VDSLARSSTRSCSSAC